MAEITQEKKHADPWLCEWQPRQWARLAGSGLLPGLHTPLPELLESGDAHFHWRRAKCCGSNKLGRIRASRARARRSHILGWRTNAAMRSSGGADGIVALSGDQVELWNVFGVFGAGIIERSLLVPIRTDPMRQARHLAKHQDASRFRRARKVCRREAWHARSPDQHEPEARLFSGRYREEHFGPQEVEIHIDSQGAAQMTGFPTAGIPT